MRALAYLEWRFVVHHVAAIWRSPLRLAIWTPYALSLGFFCFARVVGWQRGTFGNLSLDADKLTGIGGLYMGALGVTIALAAGGRVSGFRSTAEAVFFSNSGIRPLEMAVWLQIRKLLASALRWAGALAYYFVIFFPRHSTFAGAAIAFCTALLAVALLMSVELPIFLLSRGTFNFGIKIFAWALAVAGFGYAAIGFAGWRIWVPAIAFLRCDPGHAVRSIQNGSANAFVVFGSLIAVMVAAVAVLARDALPELYAASRRSLAELRRRQSRVRQTRYDPVVSTPATRIPLGALAIAWKDWIGFRRGHGSFAVLLAGCAASAVLGAGAAYASIAIDDFLPMSTLFSFGCLIVFVFAPAIASAGLADDLGKPIFWLGGDALRARLAAWTIGRSGRGGIALALAPMSASIVYGKPLFVPVSLAVCCCAYWSLQALGVAMFALFPNPVDTRGPMAFLRVLASFAYVVPAFVLAAIVLTLGGALAVATAVACVTLAIEGAAALEFASIRFREAGAAMALAATTA